jgi:hypothetical protein
MNSEIALSLALPRHLAELASQLPTLFGTGPARPEGSSTSLPVTIRNRNTDRAYFKAAELVGLVQRPRPRRSVPTRNAPRTGLVVIDSALNSAGWQPGGSVCVRK